MTNLVCIGCPRGCHLEVDENNDYTVNGNFCLRGAEYGKQELTDPKRVLTTSVKIENAMYQSLPVKSNKGLPKAKLIDAAKSLKDIKVKSPVKIGDVIVENILNTGVDIVSCKNM